MVLIVWRQHGDRGTEEGDHARAPQVELLLRAVRQEARRGARPRLGHAEEAERLGRVDRDAPRLLLGRRLHGGNIDDVARQFAPDGVLEVVGEADEGFPSAGGAGGDDGDSGEVDPTASPPEGSRVSGAL